MTITPYLYYQDVERALKFLARAFGFRKFGAAMRGPDGRINHAAMKLGRAEVMMGRPGGGYRNPKRLGQATQALYIMLPGAARGSAGGTRPDSRRGRSTGAARVAVSELDKHFARAREAGAVILEAPNDRPYGHRRYGASDPEGHQWYFAQALRRRPRRAR